MLREDISAPGAPTEGLHVVRGDDRIDVDILEGVLRDDLPNLARQLEALLSRP